MIFAKILENFTNFQKCQYSLGNIDPFASSWSPLLRKWKIAKPVHTSQKMPPRRDHGATPDFRFTYILCRILHFLQKIKKVKSGPHIFTVKVNEIDVEEKLLLNPSNSTHIFSNTSNPSHSSYLHYNIYSRLIFNYSQVGNHN